LRLNDPLGLIWQTQSVDYQGVNNSLRFVMNWFLYSLGIGLDPHFPGSDPEEYLGLKRDIRQVWVPSPTDPCPDQFPAGTLRHIEQTYSQFLSRGPGRDLTNDPNAIFYYQWSPWVDSRTYSSFPNTRYQYPPSLRQRE
jgi:hypothetical protein